MSKPLAIQISEAEQILTGYQDHATFCRESLMIRNKAGVSVPLELSPAQLKLNRAISWQMDRNLPVRLVALKARQVHMSVGACAEVFRRVPFQPGQRAMTLAHLERTSQEIADYYRQFEAGYKSFRGLRLDKPIVSNDERMKWANGSQIQFATAGSTEVGRSFAARFIHLDEYAFFPDAARLMTGLMQTVPSLPGTMVLAISTANGIGGSFYDLWTRACDRSSNSGWIAMFFAWWEHPEYSLPFASDEQRVKFENRLTKEERELQQRHNLTLDQLHWRRYTIETGCEGSVARFQQEYPATPEEAFLTSGRPRFDLVALGRHPIVRQPAVGDLKVVDLGARTMVQFHQREDGTGLLQVFVPPQLHRQYIIGADVAQGIDAAGKTIGASDPDYSCAQVVDRDTGEQVASLRGRITPAEFSEQLHALGRYYNWAYLVPEANNHGIAVIESLLRLEYPLHRIFTRRRAADDRRTPALEEIGWLTTTRTKPQLVHYLDRALREMSIRIHKPNTLQECRTFVTKANGSTEAQQGCHDDEVIALGLAVVGMVEGPRELPGTEEQLNGKGKLGPVKYQNALRQMEAQQTRW